MARRYDAVILGMGPGGEVVASRLLSAGRQVAVVERELIGGECGYWACIPSKTLLRPTELRGEATRTPGVAQPSLDWPQVREWRDTMVRHLDDSKQVAGYEQQGAQVHKGTGRLAGPGRVQVDGQTLEADHIVLATGSDPVIPPIDGLGQATVWTNREATGLTEVPERAVVIGGSAVGVELGQLLRRLGAQVTIVQHADRLVNREDPRVGELITETLRDDGIDVRTGRQAQRARHDGGHTILELDDGSEVTADVVVVGAGRRPRHADLGLDTVGIDPSPKGLPIDERCALGPGLWAIGDVTGTALFTHVAKYQARVAVANILAGDDRSRQRRASYTGVPRVIFSDPEIAAVGLSAAQARQDGIDVATARVDLSAALARPWTYERAPRAELELVADRSRGVLVGAWAVSALAGEWIHQAAQAVRAAVPVATLIDGIPQFPTYSEGFLTAAEELYEQLR
jgi:pyruvate/2-oxoglutarate dehydrogenase complex dihydrolipoamide dehydrogenase (E3) component